MPRSNLFANLAEYQENARLEAKAAQGGLPDSLWQTYSAFCNTIGGVILLGVEETAGHTLRARGVKDAGRLLRDFWNVVNNPNKVSVNVLADKDVGREMVDGKEIIVIRVPQASRFDQPVYLNGDILSATYRRNGDGDYRCGKAEVQAMLRDAATQTQDMKILEDTPLTVLNADSIRRYRIRMQNHRPGHVWENLENAAFLHRIAAAGRGGDGALHPTAAGLLMFGDEYEIIREFPDFFLDYREVLDPSARWSDRIISSSGDWSGNVFDFYFRVIGRLEECVRIPFALKGIYRQDETPVHLALREALANCLIHADYYGKQGVVIVREPGKLSFANPGTLRLEKETALRGGVSEPRNALLMKMFNLIAIGERAGSGIPSIQKTWQEAYHCDISLLARFAPERVALSLVLPETGEQPEVGDKIGDKTAPKSMIGNKIGDKPALTPKIGDKSGGESQISDKSGYYRRAGDEIGDKSSSKRHKAILAYIRGHGEVGCGEIAELLGLKPSRTRQILAQLAAQGALVAKGARKNRTYSLKP